MCNNNMRTFFYYLLHLIFFISIHHSTTFAVTALETQEAFKKALLDMVAESTDLSNQSLVYNLELRFEVATRTIKINEESYEAFPLKCGLFISLPADLAETFVTLSSSRENLSKLLLEWKIYDYQPRDDSYINTVLFHPETQKIILVVEPEHLSFDNLSNG